MENRADGTVVVQWYGDVDVDSAQHLRRVLVHAVRWARPGQLNLDLSGVSHIDPINLGALTAAFAAIGRTSGSAASRRVCPTT